MTKKAATTQKATAAKSLPLRAGPIPKELTAVYFEKRLPDKKKKDIYMGLAKI